jgi:Bacteriocin-protection, YdeI or OmpD-Associated/Domain of unknown function (DUF1905)
MQPAVEFDAVIQGEEIGDAAWCSIPFSVEDTFGKKRVKIKAAIDAVPYRGLLTPMGGKYFLGLNKKVRAELGKSFGATVHIRIEEDLEPRVVAVPGDFQLALAEAKLANQFTDLSYTHQKEYIHWIEDAKKTSTRNTRIEKAILMLANKNK